MKKIGIITFYKSFNVGAVLQAYALNKTIINMGHECEIIQYSDKRKKSKKMNPIKKFLHNLWYTTIKRNLFHDKKWERIVSFIEKYDRVSSVEYHSSQEINRIPPDYDIYITGSDQVWNPKITGFDDTYFLSFALPNRKRISYAASVGTVSHIENNKEWFAYLLSKLDAISVREQNAQEKIEELLNGKRKVDNVLDPTLIVEKEEWQQLGLESNLKINQKYILCYYMPGDKTVEQGIRDIANYLAEKTGLRIINLGLKDRYKLRFSRHDIFDAGPLEFIWLVDHAEYVVTNSFHGFAFSVNLQKSVYVPTNDKLDANNTIASRLVSIMTVLSMQDRLIPYSSEYDWKNKVSTEQLEYDDITSKLIEARKQSLDYLYRELENE